MNTQTISLDVSKAPAIMPVLRIRKGDKNGTTLKVNLYDGGEAINLTGYTVKFHMRLPNDAGTYEATGSVSGNVATFTIDEATAAEVVGSTCIAYVRIASGSTFACSTGSFRVVVMDSADLE